MYWEFSNWEYTLSIKWKILAVVDANFAIVKWKPDKCQASMYGIQTLNLYDTSAALYQFIELTS